MFNFKKTKVEEPKLITDEKEIWYCNEVLPLKAEMSELECKNYKLAKENKQLKDKLKGVQEERDYLFNKTSVENKYFQQENNQLKEVIEEVRELLGHFECGQVCECTKDLSIHVLQILDKAKGE